MTEARGWRRLAARAGLLLAGIVLGLLLVEAILRLRGNPYDLVAPHPDPQLGYTLRPGLQANLGGVAHAFNSRGLRDRDYPDEPGAGVTRILAVGDSITFAQSLPLDATYVKRLERMLNESRHGAFEVIHAGVSGYNACQEEAFLRHIGLAYRPELILWQYCLNDIDDAWNPYGDTNRGFVPLPISFKRGLRDHVWTWNFMRTHLFVLMQRAGTIPGSTPIDPRNAQLTIDQYGSSDTARVDTAWACVERAAALARSRGARMLVLIVPLATQMDSSAGMSDAPQRDLARRCAAAGLACVDLLPSFNESTAQELFLLPDFVHLTAAGHALMARAVEQAILGR
jgi:lysophospholipase L1-like esterase